jgi:hypothetical protein
LTFDSNGVITGASNNAVSVANTAITGNIISSQITSVSNTQITGNITAAQIISVANTQLTGLIQAAQIGSANATLVTSGTLPKARLPTGTVLQTVANTSPTSSTAANATMLTLSITPSSSSSRILLLGALEGERVAGSTSNYIFAQVRRNTSNIRGFLNAGGYQLTNGTRNFNTVMFIDSPATTSAITYDIWIDHTGSGTSSGITWNWYECSFYALEIAS